MVKYIALRERHREKPQVRTALKGQEISIVAKKVLKGLGVENPSPLFKPLGREKRLNRDLAIYILCHRGLFTHQEICQVFGVGYASISGTLKRTRSYIDSDKRLSLTDRIYRILR